MKRIIWISVPITALACALFVFAQQGSAPTASRPAPKVDAKVLRAAGTAADTMPGSWLTNGRSQSEQRYSPLKQINDSNAKRLGLAWSYVIGAGGGNQEGTPLVWNNTIYGITTWSVVYALDTRTGRELWRWDPEVNQSTVRSAICCGTVNRGVALYNGLIIAPAIDGRMFGLDALTGKPVWESRASYSQDLYTLTMAPRIANGKVIIGMAGGDRPTRGQFIAMDAMTGKVEWRFYTVPGNPENPPENAAMKKALETWGGDFWTKGGGGAVWDGFAYDPEANLVYVGTGNAEPWVQKFRGKQNVDNLYTCSILAVDLTTGQLKWYFQTTPNDNWDFDNVQQLMLLDLNINGKMRKVITQASKNGFFWVLDRVTGEYISGAAYVKTTWALGLTDKGRPIVNPEAYYDTEPIAIYPTSGGAHNWSPMSYSPNTGWVYIPVSLQPFTLQATETFTPGSTGYTRASKDPKVIDSPAIGPPTDPNMKGGALQAWDPVNQKLMWRIDGGGGIGGGTVATGGNLVFQVINDGRFRAVTADKGQIVYEIQSGRTGMAPPITYEADGKQYVAFMGGLGRAATIVGPNNAKIDGPPMLYVFALDGKADMPAPVAPPPPQGKNAPAPPKPLAPELQ
jgi:quinohemoprotein ethanol dehydrogenase